MTRKIGAAALALSVFVAIISLALKGGIGVTWAHSYLQDFNITSAKVEITHETVDECLVAGEPVSCAVSYFASDSYEILANLAINAPQEFESDLNQSIFVVLLPGTANCSNANPFTNASFEQSTVVVLPGGSLNEHSNKKWTMYSFEGNVPTAPALRISNFVFGHVEFKLKIPTDGTSATLHLEGNSNLCRINGPMTLLIGERPDKDTDPDFACINIPAPEFDTLDISSALCPLVSK